jgi:hypothetical protein
VECSPVSLQARLNGGGRGIRTPGTLSGTVVFKTTRFNRSRIPPLKRLNNLRLWLVYMSYHWGTKRWILHPDGQCKITIVAL